LVKTFNFDRRVWLDLNPGFLSAKAVIVFCHHVSIMLRKNELMSKCCLNGLASKGNSCCCWLM